MIAPASGAEKWWCRVLPPRRKGCLYSLFVGTCRIVSKA
jgi:hypothetical protein